MAKRDYYEVLSVPRAAKADEIRTAYRKLARKYHPDANKDPGATVKFQEATEAYEVLSDPEKRKLYDQFGHAGPGPQFGQGGPFGGRAGRGAGGPGGQGVTFDFSEIFGGGPGGQGGQGGGGGGGFGGMSLQDIMDALRGRGGGGRGRRQRREPQPGQDSESHVTLDFLQAVRGTMVRIRISRPDAEGSAEDETLDVKIPPGVQEGSRIRVRGKGGMGEAGAGDLYIVVHVNPHEYFRREGDDLYVNVPISITEAALGGKVDVPALTGLNTVTVPPGTASLRKLRLREKGVHRPGKTPGNLYVVIEIVPPKTLTPRQRELLEEFGKLETTNPRANCPWS